MSNDTLNESTPKETPEIVDWATHISMIPPVKPANTPPVVPVKADDTTSTGTTQTTEDESNDVDDSSEIRDIVSDIPQTEDITDEDRNQLGVLDAILAAQKANQPVETQMLENIVVPLKGALMYGETLKHLAKTTPAELFKEGFSDPTTQVSQCRDVFDHFVSGTELSLNQLKLLKKEINEAEGSDQPVSLEDIFARNVGGVGSGVSRGSAKIDPKKSKVLEGDSAILAFKNAFQGFRVIPLWNSGIKITISGCDLSTLVSYFNTVHTDGYEYGRELGAYYFMYVDYEVKRHVLRQILPKILISSTYKYWKKIDKLLDVIKLADYDVILWGIYATIAKDGTPINFLDSDGKAVNAHQYTADVSTMRQVDTRKIPHAASVFMSSRTEASVTDLDLAKYDRFFEVENKYWYAHFNPANKTTTYWCFEHQQATCANYLEAGAVFNGVLFDAIHNPSKDEVATFLSINYYRAYIPWVKCLYQVTEEGYDNKTLTPETVIFEIPNKNLSAPGPFWEILGSQNMEDTNYGEWVIDYIRRNKITYILIQVPKDLQNDKIKIQEVESGVDGFIPFDIQNHFFLTCLMRMQKTS